MTDETKGLSHQEIEEGILNGDISALESSDSSDDEVDLSFSPTKPFSPLALEANPRIEASVPKSKLTRLLSPYNIFKRFWKDEILDEFVKYTPLPDLNRGELRLFFGVLMLMGLSPKHRLKEHWSADFGTFEVQHAMSRERFQEIWMNLKIYDGVSYPDDPTKLVRHLLVRLSYIFQSQLIMGDEKSIDEIMIGYFGKKCSQTFFIPRKPSKQKNGLKLHGIADANCGYLWSMFMQPRGRHLSPQFQSLCTPTGVVDHFIHQLACLYEGVAGTHIYADK